MRWLVAWLVGWLTDWMVGWFVRDHSCDGRRAVARAKDGWKPGRERSSARIEVGRSWFFFNEERLEERIAEQIVGVLGPQADQPVYLDMLQLRTEMFEKCSSQLHFANTRCFPAAPMEWSRLPCREGRKERQGQGQQQRRPQEY